MHELRDLLTGCGNAGWVTVAAPLLNVVKRLAEVYDVDTEGYTEDTVNPHTGEVLSTKPVEDVVKSIGRGGAEVWVPYLRDLVKQAPGDLTVETLLDEAQVETLRKHRVTTKSPEENLPDGPPGIVSPVADQNAADAIHAISNMRSKEKLQHIVDTDTRVTVKEAAEKRLAAL